MTSDPVSIPAPKTVDRWLAQMRFAKVQPYIPRGSRLLDVGAGDGSFLRALSGHVSTGVGIDPLITTPVSFFTLGICFVVVQLSVLLRSCQSLYNRVSVDFVFCGR